MKRNIILTIACILGLTMMAQTEIYEWKPFVEQGKSWNYKLKHAYDFLGYFSLKIEGTMEYNNKEYAIVNAYLNDEQIPDSSTHFCYLREDYLDGITYYMFAEGFDYTQQPWQDFFEGWLDEPMVEHPLFSIFDILINTVYAIDKFNYPLSTLKIEDEPYISPSGDKLIGYKFSIGGDSPISAIDRVGYISYSGMLLGDQVFKFTGIEGRVYFSLQTVCDGDGNLIYRDPDLKVNEIEADTDENDIDYFDLQGRQVERPNHGAFIERANSSAKVKIL